MCYNQKELEKIMEIVSAKEIKGRLQDGLDTIFALKQSKYEAFIDEYRKNGNIGFYYVTDRCESPNRPIKLGVVINSNESRYYFADGGRVKQSEICHILEDLVNKGEASAETIRRAREILDARGLELLQKDYAKGKDCSIESVLTAFQVLQDEKVLYEFLNTSNSMQDIVVDGQLYNKEKVFEILGNIFGCPVGNGEFKKLKATIYSSYYYIHDYDKLVNNYAKLYNSGYNLNMFAMPNYKFERSIFKNKNIEREKELDFEINPKLKYEVYEGMPKDLSVEEKAIYVYAKLCSILRYDENVSEIEDKSIYKSNDFNKAFLESLEPNGQIICFDFARICAKFLNEIDGVNAFVLLEGVGGHFSVGFYTDKISTHLEAVNIKGEDSLNDLSRAQGKLELAGIETISDKFNIIPQAINKACQAIYGREQTTVADFVSQIKDQKHEEIQLDKLIEAFLETLKQNHICGNEATVMYNLFKRNGFFGIDIESIFIGDKHITDKGAFYQRKILLRQNGEKNPYLIDIINLNSTQISLEEVASKLNSKQFVYENKKYHLKEIESEIKYD